MLETVRACGTPADLRAFLTTSMLSVRADLEQAFLEVLPERIVDDLLVCTQRRAETFADEAVIDLFTRATTLAELGETFSERTMFPCIADAVPMFDISARMAFDLVVAELHPDGPTDPILVPGVPGLEVLWTADPIELIVIGDPTSQQTVGLRLIGPLSQVADLRGAFEAGLAALDVDPEAVPPDVLERAGASLEIGTTRICVAQPQTATLDIRIVRSELPCSTVSRA